MEKTNTCKKELEKSPTTNCKSEQVHEKALEEVVNAQAISMTM